MAATYRLTLGRCVANVLMRAALRAGVAPSRYALLTVRGRKTGRPLSTPVIVLSRPDGRWLVSPYGQRAWVENARAAGEVTLSRGRHRKTVPIQEVHGEDAAPVLRDYLARTAIARPFFDVAPDAPLAEFALEAPRHPVFRLGQARRGPRESDR